MDYLLENTLFGKETLESQVQAYTATPGQAATYKIGEEYIRNARDLYSARLGDKFDLKQFHLFVLGCQGPLDLLQRCLDMKYDNES